MPSYGKISVPNGKAVHMPEGIIPLKTTVGGYNVATHFLMADSPASMVTLSK